MTNEPEAQPKRVSSDASIADDSAGREPTIGLFFDALRSSTRWAPKTIRIQVSSAFVNVDDAGEVTVLVAPTAVRMTYSYDPAYPREAFELPEYEFEGYLVGDYPERIWVLGELKNNSDDKPGQVDEIVLHKLAPGEEAGLNISPAARAYRDEIKASVANHSPWVPDDEATS